MDGIINNPFRVLGLPPFATDKEITKRVSDLITYAEMGKNLRYDNDFDFLIPIDRSSKSIKEAARLIEIHQNRLYYSLLCFQEKNELDKKSFDLIRNIIVEGEKYQNELIKHNIDHPEDFLTPESAKIRLAGQVSANVEKSFENGLDCLGTSSEVFESQIAENFQCSLQTNEDSRIEGTSLILNNRNEKGFWLLKECKFNYKVDFVIKFDCEWIEGEENKLASIIIGKGKQNNYYRLGVSANGFIYFDLYIDGKPQNVYGWKNDAHIKIKGKNRIEFLLRTIDGERIFHIYVQGLPFPLFSGTLNGNHPNLFWGNTFGISISGIQKVAFSNFNISYYSHRLDYAYKTIPSFENYTSIINLINFKFQSCIKEETRITYDVQKAIILMGKIINSNAINHYFKGELNTEIEIDRIWISKKFIDDAFDFIKPFLNKENGISLKEFVDSFYTFPEEVQFYILSRFIGQPMIDIEKAINYSMNILDSNPCEGDKEGEKLFNSSINNLKKIELLLGYGNFQYALIANKLANKILDCAIVYFNSIRKTRDATINEGLVVFKLYNYAKEIAVSGSTEERVDDCIEKIQEWFADKERQTKTIITPPSDYETVKSGHVIRKKTIIKSLRKWDIIVISIIAFFIILAIITTRNGSETSSIPKNSNPSSKQSDFINNLPEKPSWKGNKLENGASPYDAFFGKGVYDHNSECWLLFRNGNSTDAIVCLENNRTGQTIRNEYIQAGTNFKMTNLPPGVYQIKVFYGNDWNPDKSLKSGLIKGSFDSDLSYSVSDKINDLIDVKITETYNGISYTTGEITLYTVSNGNMQQRKINSNEFFK